MTRTRQIRIKTCATLFLATVLGSTRALAVDMVQTPLFLTGSVEPNVLFLMDDSTSMDWEYLPGLYSKAVGLNLDSDAADRSDKRWYIPHFNGMYYDHTVDYQPWIRADGSTWPAGDPDNADSDPTDGSATSNDRNLQANGPYGDVSDSRFNKPVYYKFTGTDRDDPNDYTRVKINGAGTYDGGGVSRSYEEELQNYANWYTYYRKRTFAARAGIGRAFAERGSSIRLGWDLINNHSDTDPSQGVGLFEGTHKTDFYNNLYTHDVPSMDESVNLTPTREALKKAGEYYNDSSPNKGPWNTTPNDASSGENHECRSSYTMLMTDGYWRKSSDTSVIEDIGIGNSDGSAGNVITRTNGDNYQYSGSQAPFADGYGSASDGSVRATLADVAMEYWKQDLHSMDNEVPPAGVNKAFWQHMSTYTVGFGVEGSISKEDAFNAIPDELGGTGDNISWPDPTDNHDDDKVDDLLHAAVNGHGDYMNALDPQEFAEGIKDMLRSLVGRSAGSGASVAANSTRLETDTLVFQGRFNSRDWSGDLWAFNLDNDGNLTTTSWEAAELLNERDPDARNILTAGGLPRNAVDGVVQSGASFEWTDLSADQQDQLEGSSADPAIAAATGERRVDYLRGDQGYERQNGGNFRNRESVMGDIINSRPVYTKDERYGYRSWTTDKGKKYVEFIRDLQGYDPDDDPNPGMVYVGGNDGMLHGFLASSGEEVFSYVPGGLYGKLKDLTDPNYEHQYYVDGSATVGDVWFPNAGPDEDGDGSPDGEWRRVLIGTMNGGGSTVFALDITDPKNMGPDDVLWEFSDDELGAGVKDVSLVRVEVEEKKNNDDPVHRWDVVFGDGYGSGTAENDSQLFVLDATTGEHRPESPVEATSGSPNGMATPFVVDEDLDRNADMIYAGDLRGNVWKFTLDNKKQWVVSSKALFVAQDDDGNRQPITSKVDVGFNNDRAKVVTFGTGKYLESGDQNPDTTSPQSLYGLIDTDSGQISRSELREQTLESQLTEEGREYRIVSDNGLDGKRGWYVSLDPDDGAAKQGERSVVQPLIRGGVVTFVTIVPSDDPCDAGGTSWLTSVNINDGTRLGGSFFDVNDDGEIDEDDLVNDGDVAPTSLKTQSGIVDTPTLLAGEDKDTLIVSGSEGEEAVQTDSDETKGPQSWRQVR